MLRALESAQWNLNVPLPHWLIDLTTLHLLHHWSEIQIHNSHVFWIGGNMFHPEHHCLRWNRVWPILSKRKPTKYCDWERSSTDFNCHSNLTTPGYATAAQGTTNQPTNKRIAGGRSSMIQVNKILNDIYIYIHIYIIGFKPQEIGQIDNIYQIGCKNRSKKNCKPKPAMT